MQRVNRRTFGRASLATSLAVSSMGVHMGLGAQGGPRIRVGQIGTRHAHAHGKMATMRKFADEYEVVGVVEPDESQRAKLESTPTYRGLKWLKEDDLLSTRGLEAVAVETEVRDLVPTASRCVQAGMHVHLDKPAGQSLPAFRKLLDDATGKGLTIQMGYMFRYNPAFRFLFDAVKNGWLGDPFEVHGVMSKTVGAATRQDLLEYPGGSMFELGCHLIDALVAVMGKPRNVVAFNRQTRTEDKLLDNCFAVFEYERATASIRSAVVEVDGGRRRQFTLCGSGGTIEIKPLEPPQLTLTLDRKRGSYAKGSQEVTLKRLGGRYDGDFLDLAKIIRGEKSSDYPPSHDLAVQEAILRASGAPLG